MIVAKLPAIISSVPNHGSVMTRMKIVSAVTNNRDQNIHAIVDLQQMRALDRARSYAPHSGLAIETDWLETLQAHCKGVRESTPVERLTYLATRVSRRGSTRLTS